MRELYSKSQVKSMTWSCCIWSNRSIYYNKQSYLYQGPTSVWTIAEECESLSLLFSSFTYLRHYRWQGRMLHTSPPSSDFFPLHLTSRRFLVGFLHGVGVTTTAAANLFTSNFIYVIYVFISFCVNRVHHAGGWDALTTHLLKCYGLPPKGLRLPVQWYGGRCCRCGSQPICERIILGFLPGWNYFYT